MIKKIKLYIKNNVYLYVAGVYSTCAKESESSHSEVCGHNDDVSYSSEIRAI